LVVTAVIDDEEQPSRFLDELDPVDGDRAVGTVPRGTHLPALVAELRSAVCDVAADRADREAAAAELARLAAAGVRGADPQDWWGLAAVSDDGPPVRPDLPVRISPSRIESFVKCELRAILQDLGARDSDSVSASLGTLVHEIAATIDGDPDRERLERVLDERWGGLDFAAQWFAQNERERAGRIIDVLLQWLAASRADGLELVATEQPFSVTIDDAQLAGQVDRLERDEEGRLVIVDLKTGKQRVKVDEVATHAQLAAYQLAVEAGGFGEGERSGGARLVQLANPGKDPEQRQEPLADSAEAEAIRAQIVRMAQRLRGAQFTASVNEHCGYCDLRNCCPLHPDGRQVTT
jgi:RecB family exonuclease